LPSSFNISGLGPRGTGFFLLLRFVVPFLTAPLYLSAGDTSAVSLLLP
jgi:hypothetical protein